MSPLVILLPIFIYATAVAFLLTYVLILRWLHPVSAGQNRMASSRPR